MNKSPFISSRTLICALALILQACSGGGPKTNDSVASSDTSASSLSFKGKGSDTSSSVSINEGKSSNSGSGSDKNGKDTTCDSSGKGNNCKDDSTEVATPVAVAPVVVAPVVVATPAPVKVIAPVAVVPVVVSTPVVSAPVVVPVPTTPVIAPIVVIPIVSTPVEIAIVPPPSTPVVIVPPVVVETPVAEVKVELPTEPVVVPVPATPVAPIAVSPIADPIELTQSASTYKCALRTNFGAPSLPFHDADFIVTANSKTDCVNSCNFGMVRGGESSYSMQCIWNYNEVAATYQSFDFSLLQNSRCTGKVGSTIYNSDDVMDMSHCRDYCGKVSSDQGSAMMVCLWAGLPVEGFRNGIGLSSLNNWLPQTSTYPVQDIAGPELLPGQYETVTATPTPAPQVVIAPIATPAPEIVAPTPEVVVAPVATPVSVVETRAPAMATPTPVPIVIVPIATPTPVPVPQIVLSPNSSRYKCTARTNYNWIQMPFYDVMFAIIPDTEADCLNACNFYDVRGGSAGLQCIWNYNQILTTYTNERPTFNPSKCIVQQGSGAKVAADSLMDVPTCRNYCSNISKTNGGQYTYCYWASIPTETFRNGSGSGTGDWIPAPVVDYGDYGGDYGGGYSGGY